MQEAPQERNAPRYYKAPQTVCHPNHYTVSNELYSLERDWSASREFYLLRSRLDWGVPFFFNPYASTM